MSSDVVTLDGGSSAAEYRQSVGRMSTVSRWTNASVRQLAGDRDPIDEITTRARARVLDGLDRGWVGPPFDPLALARLSGIQVVGRDSIPDAQTVVDIGGKLVIEVNPNRPRARLRYSIAHELGHTLFPDCAKHVRNRSAYHEMVGDEWQLEALCNIAAAEFLMPTGSFPELREETLSIDRILALRQLYEVSMEAVLIRFVRQSDEDVAVFAASRIESGLHHGSYRLDYVMPAPTRELTLRRGTILPANTRVAECAAIGFTAKSQEKWGGVELDCECVGIPPYPGSAWPRVVGFVRLEPGIQRTQSLITYLRGDALEPRGDGSVVIAQVVNDATPNWGGRGFAQAVRSRLPSVQEDFRRWASLHRGSFQLGEARLYQVSPGLWVESMIAQEGYGVADTPRLRYGSLQRCLIRLARDASQRNATVHMPRIGAGQAGGDWTIIEELIQQEVCERGVSVTVYDLPTGSNRPVASRN